MSTSISSKIELLGIEPNSGPVTGNTRVLVRGNDFSSMDTKYPNPKCRFGRDDRIVRAAYIKCTWKCKILGEEIIYKIGGKIIYLRK